MAKFKALTLPWLFWVYFNMTTYGLLCLLLVPFDAAFRAVFSFCKELRDHWRFLTAPATKPRWA